MATPGVTKEVTKGGDNTNFPEKGDEVTMEYTGTDPLPASACNGQTGLRF